MAPAGRFSKRSAERAVEMAALRPGRPIELEFHPQCFLTSGHFAGPDEARARAIVEIGNDPAIDAVWFGRGGYGSNRVAERAVAGLSHAALKKPWLGYSDMGFMLAALFNAGATNVAHGPMVADGGRYKGAEPLMRALDWLVEGKADACEPSALKDSSLAPEAAFGGTFHINEAYTQLERAYTDATRGSVPAPQQKVPGQ